MEVVSTVVNKSVQKWGTKQSASGKCCQVGKMGPSTVQSLISQEKQEIKSLSNTCVFILFHF